MTPKIEAELIDVIEVHNKLGEGVTWDSRNQTLWWTDILAKKLYHLDWDTRQLKSYLMPEKVCSFGLTDNPETLLIAFENGLAFYQPVKQSKRINWLNKIYDSSGVRLNDGRMDRQGRFWVGSMVEGEVNEVKDNGKLFSFNGNRHTAHHLSDLLIPNSLCWSPDSNIMYFADSPTNTIMKYDFDAVRGLPSNPKTFATTSSTIFPDGSDVDSEGNLWNAEWGGERITCYSPSGSIKGHIKMPVSQPTCIAFGGKNLDILFVTTAGDYLSEPESKSQPLAGNLFIYKTNYIGLESVIYTDNLSTS